MRREKKEKEEKIETHQMATVVWKTAQAKKKVMCVWLFVMKNIRTHLPTATVRRIKQKAATRWFLITNFLSSFGFVRRFSLSQHGCRHL